MNAGQSIWTLANVGLVFFTPFDPLMIQIACVHHFACSIACLTCLSCYGFVSSSVCPLRGTAPAYLACVHFRCEPFSPPGISSNPASLKSWISSLIVLAIFADAIYGVNCSMPNVKAQGRAALSCAPAAAGWATARSLSNRDESRLNPCYGDFGFLRGIHSHINLYLSAKERERVSYLLIRFSSFHESCTCVQENPSRFEA
jgi:hypothetical protein